jgi:uncharacterized protein YlzI (FlbEa/FlbD family)
METGRIASSFVYNKFVEFQLADGYRVTISRDEIAAVFKREGAVLTTILLANGSQFAVRRSYDDVLADLGLKCEHRAATVRYD